MANNIEYKCRNCGFIYNSIDQIFWIGQRGDVHIEPFVEVTSALSSKSPINGYFGEYFCHDCNKFIHKFVVHEKIKEIADATIIDLIEKFDKSPKIIEFDNKFQRCINCGKDLSSRAVKYFAYDVNDEFHIDDVFHEFYDDENYKFRGEYHGYYCRDCKKQINKFVLIKNNADLADDEIKNILNNHTNDLTIYINRDFESCPICGSEIQFIDESSICPKCKEKSLEISQISPLL